MLVWVASFPRSGNTFLRIILHRLYGVRTSTVYDVDGVAARLGTDLIGFTERPGELADLRAGDEPHFIKTHRQRDADVDERDHAVWLVRDGRDAPMPLATYDRCATGRPASDSSTPSRNGTGPRRAPAQVCRW